MGRRLRHLVRPDAPHRRAEHRRRDRDLAQPPGLRAAGGQPGRHGEPGRGTWQVWFGNIGWNVISYVRTSAASSIDFAVNTFYSDAVSRGYAQRSWYLTSVQAGVRTVGRRRRADAEQLHLLDQRRLNQDTTAPTAPSNLNGGGTTSSSTNLVVERLVGQRRRGGLPRSSAGRRPAGSLHPGRDLDVDLVQRDRAERLDRLPVLRDRLRLRRERLLAVEHGLGDHDLRRRADPATAPSGSTSGAAGTSPSSR